MRELKLLQVFALAAFIVSGCGSTGSGSAGPKPVNISFVYSLKTLNAMQEMVMGAKAAAQASPGVTFSARSPQETDINGPAEVKVFQSATQTAKDGVALVTPVADVFINPLQQALLELTPEQREVFVLKHVEDLSYEEIAGRLGATIPSLKMRMHRAYDRLRERLKDVL